MKSPHVLGTVALVAVIAACKQAPPAAKAPAAAAPPQDVTITAVNYALTMPDTLKPGLTTFRFINNGTELHQAQLIRLDSAKTLKDVMALGDKRADWEVWVGGPNATMPHDSTNATVMLEPGHYVAICIIPSPDGTPHIMKGMATEFDVVGPAPAAAAWPKADVTVKTSDYAFDVTPAITSGTHTVQFENAGPQVHEALVVKLQPGKTGKDFFAWVGAGQKGPPPITAVFGMSSLSVGQTAEATFNFPAGNYALICFLPDKKDGAPHAAHGMIKDFTVN